MTTDLDALWPYELRRGASRDPRSGACLLDAVSWFEYGCLGDKPACVSPVLTPIGHAANDWSNDAERQELRRFIPLLTGTNGDSRADNIRADYLRFLWGELRAQWSGYLHSVVAGISGDFPDWRRYVVDGGTVGMTHAIVCTGAQMQLLFGHSRRHLSCVLPMPFGAAVNTKSLVVTTTTLAADLRALAVNALEVGCAIGRREDAWRPAGVPERIAAFAAAREKEIAT